MAKLTDVRDTPEIANGAKVIAVPVKGSTTIYQGALVALDADGYAIPGKKAENLTAVGRAEETVANAGADGELVVRVARGVFVFDKDDSLLKAQVAVQVMITFNGGVYRDTGFAPLTDVRVTSVEKITRKEPTDGD